MGVSLVQRARGMFKGGGRGLSYLQVEWPSLGADGWDDACDEADGHDANMPCTRVQ